MKTRMEALKDDMRKRLEVAMDVERLRQLGVHFNEGTLLEKVKMEGQYRFDNGAVDLVYQFELDAVCRELNDMVLKEQLFEEQKDEIIDAIM